MADKLDLPHPAKLVPAKKDYLKLLTPETPNNFLTMLVERINSVTRYFSDSRKRRL